MKKQGALSDQMIRSLITSGHIQGAEPDNVRSASLDLSLTEELFRIEGDFLPFQNETVREVLEKFDATPHSFDTPLGRDSTYAVRLNERLELPDDVYMLSNPKSSTGRNGALVRVVTDGTARYDTGPRGHAGELWLLIQPGPYSIKLRSGETLSQARFFNQDTRLSADQLAHQYEKEPLLFSADDSPIPFDQVPAHDSDGSLVLSADLSGSIAGWECLGSSKILDFAKRNHYTARDFFDPLIVRGGRAILRAGGFYILATKELVRVPPDLACEMEVVDPRTGQFISHRAGFIDPGWGYGTDGAGHGRRLVLEVIPFRDVLLRDGQAAGKIRFEKMAEVPKFNYDSLNSNYIQQSTPKLSKHFTVEVSA